ncbi:MAG: NTP transferase domain-containing protein [Myxococcales bacterium]|nr:NTP transferase domain-containing protein [Myxococcales bacterium]
MRFGAVAAAEAVGAVLAHTLHAADRVLKKGTVLTAADVAALAAAGHATVVCARLEPGELDEDTAAAIVAAALVGPGVRAAAARTGRANLHVTAAGLVTIDGAAIAGANAIDEAITVATVAAHAPVAADELVATVKIIPFAAAAASVAAAAAAVRGAVTLHPWRARRAGLVLTRFADTAAAALERTIAVQRARVAGCGGALVQTLQVEHDVGAVAAALAALRADGCDLLLALGASAIMDRRDVIPAALVAAGGALVRLGMPVDPGNLLLLGALGDATVIGVPGCARSRKRSGFDWVLERVCADVPITAADLAGLGVGGLLDEPAARPSPRSGDAAAAEAPRVAAIVLAAGRGTRMGGGKLTALLDGEPLIRRTVAAVQASAARPVVVVTGADADGVRAALAGLDVTFAHNPDFADGLSTSLRVGVAAVAATDADAALVCLGDMPRVTAAHLDALIAAAAAAPARSIIIPTCARKRGNPILWARRHFADMMTLTGDVGARALIDRDPDRVQLVELDDPAILLDVDTPAALAAVRAAPPARS